MRNRLGIQAAAVFWLMACSQDVGTGRRCASGMCVNGAPDRDGGMDNPAGSGGAGSSGGAAGDAIGSDNALTVRVEDIEQMTITVVTVQCAGECADVEAVAEGGHAPYRFEWEDGSTRAKRRVCPDASTHYSVQATDTAIVDGEFPYDAHTGSASVTANVLDCSGDAGVDASVPPPSCDDGEVVVSDVMGEIVYFDDGAELPAGRYRISYLDGCMKFGPPVDWSVNNVGVGTWYAVGETSDIQYGVLPGIAGFGLPAFDECVAQSRLISPLEIDVVAGKLGVWLFDYPSTDNIPGEDGRNPTWCLTRL